MLTLSLAIWTAIFSIAHRQVARCWRGMWVDARWAPLLSGVAAVLAVGVGSYQVAHAIVREGRDSNMRREVFAKAERAKADLDRRFPVGSLQTVVVTALRNEFEDVSEINGGRLYRVAFAEVASGVWYCGPMHVVLETNFRDGRLLSTTIGFDGRNCL
jgi:hypothetical protein